MRKAIVAFLLFLMLAISVSYVKPVSSQAQVPLQTIFIQPDGSIYPATDAIQRDGNTYIFTSNLYAAIDIFRSNIVLNGAGYTLSGPYNGTVSDVFVIGQGPNQLPQGQKVDYVIGVDIGNSSVGGVTVQNLKVENFSIGMYVWTKNNTVTGNSFSDNIVGMLVSGSNQTITENYIAQNQRGLFFGFNNKVTATVPTDIEVNHNDFQNNVVQLNGCGCTAINASEPPHNWDDGKEGNFWSDYNGTDSNNDGVGDAPYMVDALNQDRYPLLQSPVKLPVAPTKVPVEAIILGVSATVVVVAALLIWRRTKSHTA